MWYVCYSSPLDLIQSIQRFNLSSIVARAMEIASCLIESLVWNVPDEDFNQDNYREDVRCVLAHVFNNTRKVEDCSEWGEVSELKYLFRSSQPWTRDQAHQFISAAWEYIGFD